MIAEYPEPARYLDKVPFLKGKTVDVHGVVGDCAIVRAYVTDKYREDGYNKVKLSWWIETYDDASIYEHGTATIRMPSRED